jgi:hypothetical protein
MQVYGIGAALVGLGAVGYVFAPYVSAVLDLARMLGA